MISLFSRVFESSKKHLLESSIILDRFALVGIVLLIVFDVKDSLEFFSEGNFLLVF